MSPTKRPFFSTAKDFYYWRYTSTLIGKFFFSDAISGIEDTAHKNSYTVLIGQSHDEMEKEQQLLESMKKHRVDGLIVSISKNTSSYAHFEVLKNANIPIVYFDRIPNMPDIHYVALQHGFRHHTGG